MKIYQKIAGLLSADHPDHAEKIVKEHFPHGSGFDGAVWFSLDLSKPEKLVLFAEYHHMNDHGYYDGWSTLKIIVRPSLQWGFDFRLTGIKRKYRHDRDYFEDVINHFLGGIEV